jgi:hypothetical protein
VTTDVVLPTPAPDDGVLEDLPAFSASATEGLESNGYLLINAVLDGDQLSVLVDPPELETLMALVGRMTLPIVYVDARNWTAQDAEERRERLTEEDMTSEELAVENRASDEAEKHLDELATLSFSVVIGGVVHIFSFRAGWFARTEQSDEVVQGRVDRYMRHVDKEDSERAERAAKLRNLADQLVMDEEFLRLTNADTRRLRANELAGSFMRPDLMAELDVRGAIGQAVQAATAWRTEEIIPTRTKALRERLPQLADELRSDLEFTVATTSKVRDRCARDLLTSTDPVADRSALVTRLVSMALAASPVSQPVLDL